MSYLGANNTKKDFINTKRNSKMLFECHKVVKICQKEEKSLIKWQRNLMNNLLCIHVNKLYVFIPDYK